VRQIGRFKASTHCDKERGRFRETCPSLYHSTFDCCLVLPYFDILVTDVGGAAIAAGDHCHVAAGVELHALDAQDRFEVGVKCQRLVINHGCDEVGGRGAGACVNGVAYAFAGGKWRTVDTDFVVTALVDIKIAVRFAFDSECHATNVSIEDTQLDLDHKGLACGDSTLAARSLAEVGRGLR
jgi:hypothetical protein